MPARPLLERVLIRAGTDGMLSARTHGVGIDALGYVHDSKGTAEGLGLGVRDVSARECSHEGNGQETGDNGGLHTLKQEEEEVKRFL